MQRSHQEVIPGVMRGLERYREAIGLGTLAWTPDGEGDWQELDQSQWEMLRQKMGHPRGAEIRLRETDRLSSDYEFRYSGRDLKEAFEFQDLERTCAVAFWLPTEYLEKHGPAQVRKLALELGAELPFNSGHAGLSVYFSEDLYEVRKLLWPQCFRHPGLDMPAMERLPGRLGARIKGVSWLTFLGEPVLGQLGGAEGLAARLHSGGTTVENMGAGRAVVTLGEWPEAGDLEQGNTLPAYRELAQVLEPWLYQSPRVPEWKFPDEVLYRWERRFLE
ncbi:type VI immunity family protein [Hyalangium minutum]